MKIIRVNTAKRNGFFSIFSLSGLHAQEGGSSCTNENELTHGGKTQGTHFTHILLGQRPNCNLGHEVVLLNNMCSLSSQSPVGMGSGLGPGIGPWIGAINLAPE